MDTLKQVRHTERKYAYTIMITNRFTGRIGAYMQYLKFKNKGLGPAPYGVERSKDDKEGYKEDCSNLKSYITTS